MFPHPALTFSPRCTVTLRHPSQNSPGSSYTCSPTFSFSPLSPLVGFDSLQPSLCGRLRTSTRMVGGPDYCPSLTWSFGLMPLCGLHVTVSILWFWSSFLVIPTTSFAGISSSTSFCGRTHFVVLFISSLLSLFDTLSAPMVLPPSLQLLLFWVRGSPSWGEWASDSSVGVLG